MVWRCIRQDRRTRTVSQPWDISIASPSGGPVRLAGKATGEPSGGSLPAGFAVDDNATLTQTPLDQTGDSPFINLLYDPAELVDESNLGLVISARPVGTDPNPNTDLFQLGVNRFAWRSALDEGNAIFSIGPQDHPSVIATISTSGSNAQITLLHDSGTVVISSDGTVVLPNLPTADPLSPGALWNSSGTLKVSAG